MSARRGAKKGRPAARVPDKGRRAAAAGPPPAGDSPARRPGTSHKFAPAGGMTTRGFVLFLAALFLLMGLFAQHRLGSPLGTHARKYFRADRMNQNIDTTVWVWTGFMLPANAPAVRAMRPLYPAVLMLGTLTGAIPVDRATLRATPPGGDPYIPEATTLIGIRWLIGWNIVLAVAGLWSFFVLARWYGLPQAASVCATLAASSGWGFSFMVAQAIPEVFTNAAITLTLAACGAAVGASAPGTSPRRRVAAGLALGLAVGTLVLGKEIYNALLVSGIILVANRRYVAAAAFAAAAAVPTLAWNYYIVKVVGAYDPAAYFRQYGFGVWILQLIRVPPGEALRLVSDNLGRQSHAFAYAFPWPVLAAAAAGVLTRRFTRPGVGLYAAALVFSTAALMFVSNFVMPRLWFMAWPAVYLFAWAAVENAGAWLDGRLTPTHRGKGLWAARGGALCAAAVYAWSDPYGWVQWG